MNLDAEHMLAERVAEAADAWLRDPRDVGVYHRLVHAVEAWRTASRPQVGLVDPGPSVVTDESAAGHADPQQVRGALADVAAMLRRRSNAVQPEGTEPINSPAPGGTEERAHGSV